MGSVLEIEPYPPLGIFLVNICFMLGCSVKAKADFQSKYLIRSSKLPISVNVL